MSFSDSALWCAYYLVKMFHTDDRKANIDELRTIARLDLNAFKRSREFQTS